MSLVASSYEKPFPRFEMRFNGHDYDIYERQDGSYKKLDGEGIGADLKANAIVSFREYCQRRYREDGDK